jgi:hypothetical protein
VTLRVTPTLVAAAIGAAGLDVGAFIAPANASHCSVFSRHPCAPTYCSPFRHRPCRPFYGFPFGENLQLTIESKSADGPREDASSQGTDREVDSIRTMFDALRACWQPPPEEKAREGIQLSVRLSFTRDGNLKGMPRFTYVSPTAPAEAKQVYEHAIQDALARCTPMPFAKGMGGAIAGRPIAIRFIDNRTHEERP